MLLVNSIILCLRCLVYICLLPPFFTPLLTLQWQLMTLMYTSRRNRNNFAPFPQTLLLQSLPYWFLLFYQIILAIILTCCHITHIFKVFLDPTSLLKQPPQFSVPLYLQHLKRAFSSSITCTIILFFQIGTLESSTCIFILPLSVSSYCRFFMKMACIRLSLAIP